MQNKLSVFRFDTRDVDKPIKDNEASIELEYVLNQFKDVFPDDLLVRLPPKRRVDHKIEVVPGSTPSCKVPYRLAPNELEECKAQIKELLAKGFIQPNILSCRAPALFVKKKDGGMRMCIDYRPLN